MTETGHARTEMLLSVLGSAAAGGLLTLSLAPFDWWICGIGASAVLFACASRARGLAMAVAVGLAFGLAKYGTGASWVYVSIHVYGNASVALAVAMTALFVTFLALFPAGALVLWNRYLRCGQRWSDIFSFASVWTLCDWLLTWFLSGFPWLFPGYAHVDTWLGGLAPLAGVLGIGWVIVASGAALASLVVTAAWRPRTFGLLLAMLALPWGAGLALRNHTFTEAYGAPIEVLLAQGNVPQELKWQRGTAARILRIYQELSATARGVDLVLWPEVAITVGWPAAEPWLQDQAAALNAGARGATLVTGVLSVADESDYRNGAVAVGSGGGLYEKRRLVPFGDYLPFAPLLRGLIEFFDMPYSGTRPGASEQPALLAGDLEISMAICYEIAFPALVANQPGHLLATITNDTWFGSSAGPHQHFQMARMRAMENHRPLIRAANNGITAAVGPGGRVLARLPQFERGALQVSVQPRSGHTPFSVLGHWPVIVLSACCLGLALWRRASPSPVVFS